MRDIIMKSKVPALYIILIVVILFSILFLNDCSKTVNQNRSDIYPMYVDNNTNGINDYFEAFDHNTTAPPKIASISQNGHMMYGPAPYNHPFTDDNGDGICDYAQNGSNTWHGPGFLDSDNDGYCDYWEANSPMHNRQGGMYYRDENNNQINDYMEKEWHEGYTHEFTDNNGDGICDYAQDGSDTWHGPGFVDTNNDGICDYWEDGGRGHGPHNGMMGGH